MISLRHLEGKTIGVLGLGKTGTAVAKALRAAEIDLVVWDDNMAARAEFSIDRERPIVIEPPQQWDWRAMDLLVLSPGLPLTHPEPHVGVRLARAAGVPIVGDIELLYQAQPEATYIAITGTNGKSTTTSLIGHILAQAGRRVQVGGNLGNAALNLEALDKDGIYVLELSSYQLDLLESTKFDVAVLLNISPDHLDRHGDMHGYIAAKQHIFDRQTPQDVAVVGVDDGICEAICRSMIAAPQRRVIPIGASQHIDGGVWVKDGVLHAGDDAMNMAECKTLRGTHNHQNAAAAYAACAAVGLSHAQIVAGMKTYPGLAHRMQQVGVVEGVVYVNDSKATNADAAAKSLGSYEQIYWIAGGVPKAGGIASLAAFFPRIKKAFLIGQAAEQFAATLQGHVPYEQCSTLDNAVLAATTQARKDALPQAVVLLAPACASFDQFKSFEHRGDAFAQAVSALSGKQAHAV